MLSYWDRIYIPSTSYLAMYYILVVLRDSPSLSVPITDWLFFRNHMIVSEKNKVYLSIKINRRAAMWELRAFKVYLVLLLVALISYHLSLQYSYIYETHLLVRSKNHYYWCGVSFNLTLSIRLLLTGLYDLYLYISEKLHLLKVKDWYVGHTIVPFWALS